MRLPGGPVVKTMLPIQGVWVQSLVRELRSHELGSRTKKKENIKFLTVTITSELSGISNNYIF